MPWICLVAAGLLEVVWATALKRASEPLWLTVTIVALAASTTLLGLAARSLPIGLAYAIWVGIGVVGTVTFSVLVHGERLAASQWLCLAVIAVGIVGLKLNQPGLPTAG